jgi:hypothetical protein
MFSPLKQRQCLVSAMQTKALRVEMVLIISVPFLPVKPINTVLSATGCKLTKSAPIGPSGTPPQQIQRPVVFTGGIRKHLSRKHVRDGTSAKTPAVSSCWPAVSRLASGEWCGIGKINHGFAKEITSCKQDLYPIMALKPRGKRRTSFFLLAVESRTIAAGAAFTFVR